jgi:hypothetical protein
MEGERDRRIYGRREKGRVIKRGILHIDRS